MASLLKDSSDGKKEMSAIIGSEKFHEPTSCSPPCLGLGSAADGLTSFWKRISTMSKTRLTRSGGCLSCLSRPMSLAVIALRAFSASSSAGLAASRSSSTASFCAPMMTASDATDSLITFASAFFFSALAVDAVISCTMMAPFSCATTSVFSFSRTSILIASTSLAASRSLSSPVLIESASTCTKSSFLT